MSTEILSLDNDQLKKDGLHKDRVPIPRYTYPIVIGLAISFPKEMAKNIAAESLDTIVSRVGSFSPYAVSLNETADIGISAELKLSSGVGQDRFVPLFQTAKMFFKELDKRKSIFIEKYPDFASTVNVVENDFMLLSRNRDNISTPKFVEMDSGIIEAAYSEVAIPGFLSQAGLDFPGQPCRNANDLQEKYKIYLSEEKNISGNSDILNNIRRLHGVEMLMKLDDDKEGAMIDKLLKIPNYKTWIKEEAERLGLAEEGLFQITRNKYVELAGGGVLTRKINEAIIFSSAVSGKLKDLTGCGGIVPTDDLWQMTGLIRKSFTPGCTTLRHQLEKSGLLDRAFGK
jgi:hypothetical protein